MDLRSILDGSKIFRQVLGYCAQTNVGSQSSARASQSWPRPPQPPSAAGAIARCFFLFSWTSLLKHLVLKAFLAGNLPNKLSKLGVLDERSMKRRKIKTRIASECQPSHFCCKYIWKMHDLELIRGSRLSPGSSGSSGSGVRECGSDPPFYTRRRSG